MYAYVCQACVLFGFSAIYTYVDLHNNLYNLIRCIKYFNLMMNFQDVSIHYDSDDNASTRLRRSSQVIFNITVISDKTAQPPLLCLVQYFA